MTQTKHAKREGESATRRERDRQASNRPPAAEGSAQCVQVAAGNQALQRLVDRKRDGPALTVSHPSDPAEREAERVASRVLSSSWKPRGGRASVMGSGNSGSPARDGVASASQVPRIHTAPGSGAGSGGQRVGPDVERTLSSAGSGRPLGQATRDVFEPRFERDFGDVRVHTGGSAVALNRRLGARAFTHGADVYFGAGQYSPGTADGRRLLAHELAHVVQQTGDGAAGATGSRRGATTIQRNVLGTIYEEASGVVEGARREAGEFLGDAEQTYESAKASLGGALARVYERATNAVGMDPAALLSLLRSLDTATLQWLATAEQHVWDAIAVLDSRAFRAILRFGRTEFEKIAIVGENLYTFLAHLPFRVWRVVVHNWAAIAGTIDWLSTGLARAAVGIERAVPGASQWLVEGASRLRTMLANAAARGAPHAREFVMNPSRETLLRAVTATLNVPPASIAGFAQWGVEGYAAAKLWARGALQGIGRWLYDGLAGGLRWAEDLLAYVIDLSGLPELAQITYGMAFSMRPLKRGEVTASGVVHPSWFVPYNLVRVDENSVLAGLSGRAFVSFHLVHFPKAMKSMATMVHELMHVGQYDARGSVYIPGALHAQSAYGSSGGVGTGTAYDFERVGPLPDQRRRGRTFADLNPEAQAQLCEYYYVNCRANRSGGPATAACSEFQPWLDDLEQGRL